MNKIVKNVGTVYIHTGNLLENKNKIKERDICENASNFGVKNSAITLIALIITILLRYDDIRKYSNNSKFLLPINC